MSKEKDRKHESDCIAEGIPIKQPKLVFQQTGRTASQQTVDRLIVEYIVNEMRPLRTVESESFKALVLGLSPSSSIMCRQTLHEKINATFTSMKSKLQSELDKATYVCTTADIWSSSNRSFLGMTGHWIDSVSLTRKSVALSCQRFVGKHSFDKIASVIAQAHASYNIESKVLMTCTDNGSNMIKAFAESAQSRGNILGENETNSSVKEDDDEGDDDDSSADEDNDTEICFDSGMTDILSDCKTHSEVAILPEHIRCCSHTLNLVATTDADKALTDGTYKKIYRHSMAKASALWNLTSRSTKAADAVFAILGYRLIVPCVTRWNSYYNAVKKIVAAEDKMMEVCKAVGLAPLLQLELSFLKEYLEVMAPVAASIDILQGDKMCSLGYVLPTLTMTMNRLAKLDLRHAKPLQVSVIQGINNRFGTLFNDKEFLLAAVTHPKFKLLWIDDPAMRAQCTLLLEQSTANVRLHIR